MIRTVLFTAFVLAATSLGAANSVTVRLTPHFTTAPGNLMILVAVIRNAANRALEVEADSGTFYRSSSVQLDGDQARKSQTFNFTGLPAGEYDLTVRLITTKGESVVHDSFRVLSAAGDDGGQ